MSEQHVTEAVDEYPMGRADRPERDRGEVGILLDGLEKFSETLRGAVTRLGGALTPVVRPSLTSEAATLHETRGSGASPVADRLATLRDQMREHIATVDRITESLDL